MRVFLALSAIIALALGLLPLQMLALTFDWPMRRWLPGVWHRFACRALGLRIRVIGALDTRRPLMLAATHASWKDILILGALADVAFIAKSEVREWPVFGHLARLQHSIFIARNDKRGTGTQVNEIAARMADGEIVVLFPEGTTSDGNRVLPVKSSLFGAATAALPSAPDGVVRVQPVTIAYTGVYGLPMGRYHRPLAGWPGEVALVPHLLGVLKAGALDVEVSFGRPIDFREGDSRKALAATVEADLRRMLNASLRGRHRRA
nr:lysophospholipid acyltransferase family protein [Rhizobium halophytocola]